MDRFQSREEFERWKAQRARQNDAQPPSGGGPNAPKPPQKGWWARNWLWVTITLAGVSVIVVGTTAVVFIFLKVGLGFMKSSDVYKEAMAAARSNKEVVELLGEPIEDGIMYTGNIQIYGDSGQAQIAIPVHGPRGDARIYVDAIKKSGQWEFNRLVVKDSSSEEVIDLLGLDGLQRTGPPI